MRFNPRTRVGCDANGTHHIYFDSRFNPRTRVGCDFEREVKMELLSLFQSTHPRGVRPLESGIGSRILTSFNPRTRVGCDILELGKFSNGYLFQSTHPRGVRHKTIHNKMDRLAMFQSTHPRGVRPAAPSARADRADPGFNPRTRVGCDNQLREAFALQRFVSIHAPAWGATLLPAQCLLLHPLFQSTHPRGVRR